MSKQLSRLKGYMANRLEAKSEMPPEVAVVSAFRIRSSDCDNCPRAVSPRHSPALTEDNAGRRHPSWSIADETQALIAAGDKVYRD